MHVLLVPLIIDRIFKSSQVALEPDPPLTIKGLLVSKPPGDG